MDVLGALLAVGIHRCHHFAFRFAKAVLDGGWRGLSPQPPPVRQRGSSRLQSRVGGEATRGRVNLAAACVQCASFRLFEIS